MNRILLLIPAFWFLFVTPIHAQKLLRKEVFDTARACEYLHPAEFMMHAGSFWAKGDKFGGAFLYQLGELRYRFYLWVTPGLDPTGDPAIFSSLHEVMGGEINFYLGGHTDTDIIILDSVLAWQRTHEYHFCPKRKNPGAYDSLVTGFRGMRDYILKNKQEILSENRKRQKEMEQLR
jgi:hypothetical protein